MSTRDDLIENAAREDARHYYVGTRTCACGIRPESSMSAHRAAAVIDALGIEPFRIELDIDAGEAWEQSNTMTFVGCRIRALEGEPG